jgi:hypothetical protein
MPNTSTTSPARVASGSQEHYDFPSDMSNEQEGFAAFENALDYLRTYGRENPESLALWCLGIGFVLGWKLKPW